MTLQGQSILAGRVSNPGTRNFRAIDASTGKSFAPDFWAATTADIDAAVAAATAAAASLRDPERRAMFLEEICTQLQAIESDLVERAGRETALPPLRIQVELGRTTGQLRLFAAVAREGSWVDARIDRADPDRQPVARPDVRSMLVPIGPVAVFGASNFPLAFSVAGGDSASAWASGNPVVVKAHPSHPGTSELVGQAIARAADTVGLPGGVFSLLFDDGHEVGTALVEHPGVHAVGFTGSQVGGLALMRLAAARPSPIPVYAEMGSVNPMIVLPGALAEQGDVLATKVFGSCSMGTGQFCTNPGLLFVPVGTDGDAFVARLGQLATDSTLGAMLNRGIAATYHAGSDRLAAAGIRLVGEGHSADVASPGPARVWETTLHSVRNNRALLEEVFGPSTLILRWDSVDEVEALLESLEGQLTATIHASDDEITAAAPFWEALSQRVGRLLFGGFPTGVEVNHAMVHGGPHPATSNPAATSVGSRAIRRFARLLAFQSAPSALLPEELRDDNPRGIWRLLDGEWTRDPVTASS